MVANGDMKSDRSREALRREKEVAAAVNALAEPLCREEGLELVYVQFRRESAGRVLRLYIDKPGGVSLEDCTRVSRQLSDILDVNLDDLGPYHLEVSSPGSDRPLGKAEDFDRFKGQMARIRTTQPLNGRKNFKGQLKGLTTGGVCLACDHGEVVIALEEISIARLVNFNGESKCS
jgi:ribosome maturation factor RimP